ncbi:hypothetical protein CAV_0877 [Campylobacter avium LMG 24591]|uniref:Uncharacterized protein n=1 Tax=Campylobacter avium LMG 24591 TaxID=522484 RepID=A0A222MXA0_9BACT|nr:hypothetical protein [Campylobacter avium]ASQ30539.1 hypothetical protein CAV_0877 [Campylobacter avium LMG 24591]OYD79636.1 hypothetical protein CAV8706_0881 [Campylobacter avium]
MAVNYNELDISELDDLYIKSNQKLKNLRKKHEKILEEIENNIYDKENILKVIYAKENFVKFKDSKLYKDLQEYKKENPKGYERLEQELMQDIANGAD